MLSSSLRFSVSWKLMEEVPFLYNGVTAKRSDRRYGIVSFGAAADRPRDQQGENHMPAIDAVTRDLLEHTEFVTLVTEGPDGPHVVGNWGDYLRKIGIDEDRLILPAGHYERTEENLRRSNRIQLMAASRAVRGTRGPGQGCVVRGKGSV